MDPTIYTSSSLIVEGGLILKRVSLQRFAESENQPELAEISTLLNRLVIFVLLHLRQRRWAEDFSLLGFHYSPRTLKSWICSLYTLCLSCALHSVDDPPSVGPTNHDLRNSRDIQQTVQPHFNPLLPASRVAAAPFYSSPGNPVHHAAAPVGNPVHHAAAPVGNPSQNFPAHSQSHHQTRQFLPQPILRPPAPHGPLLPPRPPPFPLVPRVPVPLHNRLQSQFILLPPLPSPAANIAPPLPPYPPDITPPPHDYPPHLSPASRRSQRANDVLASEGHSVVIGGHVGEYHVQPLASGPNFAPVADHIHQNLDGPLHPDLLSDGRFDGRHAS